MSIRFLHRKSLQEAILYLCIITYENFTVNMDDLRMCHYKKGEKSLLAYLALFSYFIYVLEGAPHKLDLGNSIFIEKYFWSSPS